MISSQIKLRLALATAIGAAAFALLPHARAADVPSGEVTFAQDRVEPVYNGLDGTFAYLATPENARINPNARTVADIYVVMYPTEVAGIIGTVNCQHQPADNCPDHGPLLTSLAEAMAPQVYPNGVWGHDHIAAMPKAPAGGGEFSINWIPVMVLFNTPEGASQHLTTLAQIEQAQADGLITEVPLPPATFHGSPVSAAVYANGTPVDPAPSVP